MPGRAIRVAGILGVLAQRLGADRWQQATLPGQQRQRDAAHLVGWRLGPWRRLAIDIR